MPAISGIKEKAGEKEGGKERKRERGRDLERQNGKGFRKKCALCDIVLNIISVSHLVYEQYTEVESNNFKLTLMFTDNCITVVISAELADLYLSL